MKKNTDLLITIGGIVLGVLAILLSVSPESAMKNIGAWANILNIFIIIMLIFLYIHYERRCRKMAAMSTPTSKLINYDSDELRNDIMEYLDQIREMKIIAYSSETLNDHIKFEDLRKYSIDMKLLVRNNLEEKYDQSRYNVLNKKDDWKKSTFHHVRGRIDGPMRGNIQVRFYSGLPMIKTMILNCDSGRKIAYVGVYRWINDLNEIKKEGSQYVGADCILFKIVGDGKREQRLIEQIESRFDCYWTEHSINSDEMEQIEKGIPEQLKTVFFDFDGVVVDSMKIHEQAWINAAKTMHVCIDPLIPYLREGEVAKETARYILQVSGKDPFDESSITKILKTRNSYLDENYNPDFFPGMEQCIKAFRGNGLKTILVTGTSGGKRRETITKMCSGLFDDMVFGDEPVKGKPAAAPYLLGLKKSHSTTTNSIAIENSPFGIKSAVAAEIPCIGFNLLNKLDDKLLEAEGCITIIKDVLSLREKILDKSYLEDLLRYKLLYSNRQ